MSPKTVVMKTTATVDHAYSVNSDVNSTVLLKALVFEMGVAFLLLAPLSFMTPAFFCEDDGPMFLLSETFLVLCAAPALNGLRLLLESLLGSPPFSQDDVIFSAGQFLTAYILFVLTSLGKNLLFGFEAEHLLFRVLYSRLAYTFLRTLALVLKTQ